jgi:hypothetical protein
MKTGALKQLPVGLVVESPLDDFPIGISLLILHAGFQLQPDSPFLPEQGSQSVDECLDQSRIFGPVCNPLPKGSGGFEDSHQGIDPDDEGNDQGSFLEPAVYPGLISPLLHKTEVSGMLKHIVIFVFDKHLIFLPGNEPYVQYSCIHVQTPL